MRQIGWFIAIFLALGAAMAVGEPRQDAVSDQQLDAAIDAAKNYLYGQLKDDNWETVPEPDPKEPAWDTRGGQWGQSTALAIYALLEGGEGSQSPRLAPAIKWLAAQQMHGVSTLALRCRVWMLLHDNPDMRRLAHADALQLEAARKQSPGKAAGYWDYVQDKTEHFDRTASQYAVFGLRACSDFDEIPDELWTAADAAWRRDQREDGSWSYERAGGSGAGNFSVTADGVATLLITGDFVSRRQPADTPGNAHDKNVELGVAWMGRHIEGAFHDRTNLESLFALRRVAMISGRKYIGTVDWFSRGAEFLIATQDKETGRLGAGAGRYRNVRNTAFGLLFLAGGKFPIVMSKLDYSGGAAMNEDGSAAPASSIEPHWNQRPRDAGNLSRWIGRNTESVLRWQVTSLDATAEQLLDSPILYVAGDGALALTDQQKGKLRQFVLRGGLILGNADGGQDAFADSFRKLGGDFFGSYEFRALPARHAIYADEQFPIDTLKQPPNLSGMSNGVREFMLLESHDDPARAWNYMLTVSGGDAFKLGANVFLYAAGKAGLERRESFVVTADGDIHADRSVTVARLKYKGNWDPEPLGWDRLAAVMHNQDKVDLKVKTVELGGGGLGGIAVAHLTGTERIDLSDAQKSELHDFVSGGGLLVIDVAGGAGNVAGGGFAASIEAQLNAIFGDIDPSHELARVLPMDDAFFKNEPALVTAGYREYARKVVGHDKSARLHGLHIEKRLGVVFSSEDISGGLVGEPVDGIVGYDPATATLIMRKLVLSAAK